MPCRLVPVRSGVVVLALAVCAAAVQAKPTGHARRRSVDAIIIHSLGGPDCQAGQHFYRAIDGDARAWLARFNALPIVSIHYIIGRDGDVAVSVPESLAATHAIGWNQRSIGIELVNNADGVDPFPQAQIDALLRLVRDIRHRHPAVTPDRILRHSDVDHSHFPSWKHGAGCAAYRRKEDPGDAFPWASFKAALSADAMRTVNGTR
jgi:N-acetyl-anhydromuramyl-L-alanine amidase AmpD